MQTEPYFMEWVIVDHNGWTLKEDAPARVQRDFEDFMESLNMIEPIGNNDA